MQDLTAQSVEALRDSRVYNLVSGLIGLMFAPVRLVRLIVTDRGVSASGRGTARAS